MKQYLISFFILFSLASCQDDASETETTTITTTKEYSGVEGGSETGEANVATGTGAEATAKTVIIDNRKKEQKPVKKYIKSNPLESGNYPEASNRKLTDKDLAHVSGWGYKLMLNEVYARHGQKFSDPDLQAHFDKQPWYKGTTKNAAKALSAIEKQNVEFLKNNPR